MSEQMQKQTTYNGVTFWESDPAFIGASIVTIANVPIESLRQWMCPCCSACKALYAQDEKGRVWFSPTTSTEENNCQVVRLDSYDEVGSLLNTYPLVEDRCLIAIWYASGLYDKLTGLFAS